MLVYSLFIALSCHPEHYLALLLWVRNTEATWLGKGLNGVVKLSVYNSFQSSVSVDS